ncbi:hypothetical protein H2248_009783 [Termitomyces sp. 'cryptogamus']|nr:hypothetical protein H2248_009783 [Termitomyces sp. 'cryptogamus']
MNSWTIDGLTSTQRAVLTRGNLRDTSDIALSSSQEIARKCKISASEARSIIDALYNLATPPRLQSLGDVKHEGSETCTTGDSLIDVVLGGGIRPGMVWEIAGESAAGKTQFALQLALFVQLPQEKKGLSGSTCYITTSSTLQTSRLVQMMKTNSSLLGECDLRDIHTLATPTIPHLIHVLSERLTPFIDSLGNKAGFKPVRLLVIDALAELFHTSNKTTTNTLVERSRNITQISFLLHDLVRKHKLAVLILNEVVDVFDRTGSANEESETLLYSEQARWFSRAHSVLGENTKEVSLGMVWANQINARILLSRTGRRRFLDDAETSSVKRFKSIGSSARPNAPASSDLALIRRLSVIFSCVSRPVSLDFVVTEAGISSLSEGNTTTTFPEEVNQNRNAILPLQKTLPASKPASGDERYQISPLDVGIVEDWKKAVEKTSQTNEDEEPPEDEWDGYWATNTISQVELDALDNTSFT